MPNPDVACPHCQAQPRMRCTGPDGKPLRYSSAHPSRLEAAGLKYDRSAVAKYREEGEKRAAEKRSPVSTEPPQGVAPETATTLGSEAASLTKPAPVAGEATP